MSNEDKPNGKVTRVELEVGVDKMRELMPYAVEETKLKSRLLRARFESLVAEGFTEAQALEIVKARPLFD